MWVRYPRLQRAQPLPFRWLGSIRTKGGPSAPQENKQQSGARLPEGGAEGALPTRGGGPPLAPRAPWEVPEEALGLGRPFPQVSGPLLDDALALCSSPQLPGPGSAPGKPSTPLAGTGALSPTRQPVARAAVASREPQVPRARWMKQLNFPRDKQKRREKVPSPPGPAARGTHLHPSRSPCRSRPAARCSRSLRTWPRCPCTPAPRSVP